MNAPGSSKGVLLCSLLALALPAGFFFWKIPAPGLSAPEKELTNLRCAPLIIAAPEARPPFSGLEWHFRVAAPKQPAGGTGMGALPPPPIPVAQRVAPGAAAPRRDLPDRTPVLSLIYHEGSTRTAIIDGQIAHEGALVGGCRVLRIEEARVLVARAGKDTWLSTDQ